MMVEMKKDELGDIKMEIYRISECKYKVIDNGVEKIMTLDEVMYELSKPVSTPYKKYEANEDFWREGK